MSTVEHPLIKPGGLEWRQYQAELAAKCSTENTLVVIPTGLGKTAIALLVVANHLQTNPNGRCLVLAPTRVLVHQHHAFLADRLTLPPDSLGFVTGEDLLGARRDIWSKHIVCATPQVAEADVERGHLSVNELTLVIFDEAHRAVGNYPYCTLGALLVRSPRSPRVIGMTASLPNEEAKVKEILRALAITKIEARDEKSVDVKPYVQRTSVEWIRVKLPPVLLKIQENLRSAITRRIRQLETAGLVKANRWGTVNLRTLLELRGRAQTSNFEIRTTLISTIRLQHALNMLETQGVNSFLRFLDKLYVRGRSRAIRSLQEDPQVQEAYETAKGALVVGVEHPKLLELEKILRSLRSGEKAIVFASYRNSVETICQQLTARGFRVGSLIGKSGQNGLTQTQQVQTLADLKQGAFDVLVATQVGEEGLDVAECNLVVFYDNVPSAIRFVQRRGRTGRRAPGRVAVLVTQGTRDEAYYWVSRRKLGETQKIVEKLEQKEKKGPLDQYVEPVRAEGQPLIYADARETSVLIEKLRRRGAHVEVQTLAIGDFVASSDVVVERKTVEDFVKSVFDGRLFGQLAAMKETYPRPVLLLQGERNQGAGMGLPAYFGALASLVSDFQVAVFTSASDEETVELIYHIARREQVEKRKEVRVREGKKPSTLREIQRYIVAGVPGVSTVLADRLLTKLDNLQTVFTADEARLKQVEGIGEKLARRIRNLSTTGYNQDSTAPSTS